MWAGLPTTPSDPFHGSSRYKEPNPNGSVFIRVYLWFHYFGLAVPGVDVTGGPWGRKA